MGPTRNRRPRSSRPSCSDWGWAPFAGGWAASRWPTRLLIIYGVIEFVIGLFGFVSLQIFDWVGLRFTAASMAQTGIVAFALVVLPTLLMGATLPILVAFLVAQRGHVGSGVGILYFVNTLGSAFACVLAAEFLMEALGQRGTVATAADPEFCGWGGAIVLGRMLRATEDCQRAGEGRGSARRRRVPLEQTARVRYSPRLPAICRSLSKSFGSVPMPSSRADRHAISRISSPSSSPESPLAGSPGGRCRDSPMFRPRMPALCRLALLVAAAVTALFCAPAMGLVPERSLVGSPCLWSCWWPGYGRRSFR